jgi:hypothetical protein
MLQVQPFTTKMAAASVQRLVRRKRRKEITANDIETAPIEEFTQEESTKGSYACYIQPFIQFAVDNGWTSPTYPEAMLRNDLTHEFIQHNEIKTICSSFNVETSQSISAKWPTARYGRRFKSNG